MERADAALLSFGPPPAEGAPPVPHGAVAWHEATASAGKGRAAQVSATSVAPHDPWLRPHLTQQTAAMLAPTHGPWGTATCRPQSPRRLHAATRHTSTHRPQGIRACLMA
eukprot:scaffold159168_cov35-Tisochrysis_lutea.AAC.5